VALSGRLSKTTRVVAKVVLGLVILVAAALVAGLVALQTPWAHERIRRLAVDQANRFLTANLEIGRLGGSVLGGVTLHDVRLSRDGTDIIAIDEVEVAYSLRQFFGDDIRVRRLRLVRPRVLIARDPDGRWNVGALVRPRERSAPSGRGRRPVLLEDIEVEDGYVEIRDPLRIGFARAPATYAELDASLAFTLLPRGWEVDLDRVAWTGAAPFPAAVEVGGLIRNVDGSWTLDALDVTSPGSDFMVDGGVDRSTDPATIDLSVDAERFNFQEWAGIARALENIAVDAGFAARLRGPTREFTTALQLASNGGDVNGTFTINTQPPGWRLAGSAALDRLDIARWFNLPDRPTDFSGDATFNLEFVQGTRFPRGSWTFDGTHAAFLEYETGEVQAAGTITATDVVIDRATATAYGANIRLSGSTIGLARPFPYSFVGVANGLDLRRLPGPVPIPKVETILALEFDVDGQFVEPLIAGNASFAASSFLGASIAPGAVGYIDTSADRVSYSGEGDIANLSLERVASAFELAWLSDPRYRGTLTGRFAVEGAGSGETITLSSRGRLAQASLFGGTLSEADVTLEIAEATLSASYDGRMAGVNPAIALADERFDAILNATGRADVRVANLLIASPSVDDYEIDAQLQLEASTITGIPIDSASVQATLAQGIVSGSVEASAPAFAGRLTGRVPLSGDAEAALDYDITRADLSLLAEYAGREMTGTVNTSGRVTGPRSAFTAAGTLSATNVTIDRFSALGAEGRFEATASLVDVPTFLAGRFDGALTFVGFGDQNVDALRGSASFDRGLVTADLDIAGFRGANGELSGMARVSTDWTSAAIERLELGLNDSVWQLMPVDPDPVVVWNVDGVTFEPLTFTFSGDAAQHLDISGTWRQDGEGALMLRADGVQLETLAAALGEPDSYAGRLDLEATLSGTAAQPLVTGNILVTGGRVRQLTYEQLFGRVVYLNGYFEIGVRLDQAPGIWLTASGAFPLGLIDRTQPERPMNVAIASTPISLGLIEGLTDVVSEVTGQVELNISAVGTSHDPRFTGIINLVDAGFVLNTSGARYERGNGRVTLTADRMTVDALRIYDANGRPIDVEGSVGTEELRFRDLELDVRARDFEVLRNQYGNVSTDAQLTLRGTVESPVIAGNLTITGGELRVDRILDRMLYTPYAVEAADIGVPDAIAALNPWDRLTLDIALDVPATLRMVGNNVQVATGTPLGLGNITIRVSGDLFLRKEPGGALTLVGSLDELTGRYAFQGRRFDLDPSSTVAFSGDLDPELLITVTREISGVETRVTIAGRLSEPELRLASTPPLDPSDILSLIVFNTSVNELSLEQQEELAIRAGTLAAGLLTAPLVSALERTLGLDILEIDAASTGARVTIGDEIAPGLVARFSRQFGTDEYDEATIEYYLSRLFRIRATFSDADSVVRSPFRRVERAGIDLLLFFSF